MWHLISVLLTYRVLIATQHFLRSSALVKGMYLGMSNQERYFTLSSLVRTRQNIKPPMKYFSFAALKYYTGDSKLPSSRSTCYIDVTKKCVCVCFSLCVFSRVTLLELIFAQLKEEDPEECGIPPSVASFLATSFQKGCGAVLTLASGSASTDEVQTTNCTTFSLRPLKKLQAYLAHLQYCLFVFLP